MKPKPFHSPAVADAIERVSQQIGDADLRRMFRQCLPNTLDTTVVCLDDGEPDTYVITGDIDAMWLRDSSAQVWPYLRFLKDDPALRRLVRGLIARQSRYILLDPYANAFGFSPDTLGEHTDDDTVMKPGVFERKYEVDSLCYPIRLACGYWHATGDDSILTDSWKAAMSTLLDTWELELDHERNSSYRFQRSNCPETDTLGNDGRGTPVAVTGMTWSGFRPSDDRCQLHYLVPSEAFAVVSLRQLAAMCRACNEEARAVRAEELRAGIDAGLQSFAMVDHPQHGRMFAYETDGLRNHVLMDDANVPSLLSLPYLGYCSADDPLYRATRAFVLSNENPYFATGKYAAGIGSPHTPPGRFWHIAVTMQALTSRDPDEIRRCLRFLRDTHGGTWMMHESIDPDNPSRFSRSWFAWANTLFGELMLELAGNHPDLLKG